MLPHLCRWPVLVLLVALAQWSGMPPAAAQPAAPALDNLPPPSPPMPVLRRGPDGRIVPMKPEGAEPGSGCAPTALCVGPAGAFRTIGEAVAAAREGGAIDVLPGTYAETVTLDKPRLVLRGVGGRPHLACATLHLPDGKACLLLAAEGITVENFELSGAVVPKERGENAACLRNLPGRGFTLRAIICHGSQNGLYADGGAVLIENSEFFDNGWSEKTHNAYFAGDCTATVRGSTFRDAREGAEFKSRCRRIVVENSTFRANRGTRAIDIPEGSDAMIVGGYIWQSRNVKSPDLVGYATEKCTTPAALQLIRVRVASTHFEPRITNYGMCQGQPIVLRDIVIDGTDPKLFGYVLVNGVERPNAPPQ